MKELGELQPIRSVGQTVEEWFSQKLLDVATQHSALAEFKESNVRNAEYYEKRKAKQLATVLDTCPCCGREYEDPDW